MATPVSVIYDIFLTQVKDKDWLKLSDETIEREMFKYLKNAIVEFRTCRQDLTIIPSSKTVEEYEMDGIATEIDFSHLNNEHLTFKIYGVLSEQEYVLGKNYIYEDGRVIFGYAPEENLIIETYQESVIVSDLDDTEILILGHAMFIHYLQPQIKTNENLRQFVSDKDFSRLSNANMLLRLMGLDKMQRKQLEVYQSRYDYRDFKGFN